MWKYTSQTNARSYLKGAEISSIDNKVPNLTRVNGTTSLPLKGENIKPQAPNEPQQTDFSSSHK